MISTCSSQEFYSKWQKIECFLEISQISRSSAIFIPFLRDRSEFTGYQGRVLEKFV